MAGFWPLGFLIVTVFVHNILCRKWPNMTFRNFRAAGWELPIVTGVPSLDFVDNFIFPSKFDSKQIIVGNAHGYDDNKGEGCISIFYLRDRIKPVKKIAGNCARRSDSSFAYRDGIGASAQLKYPDHGVMSKDGKWMYFVDSRSCARRVYMWNNAVTTVIGNGRCGNGTLDMGSGQGVVGMVFLDKTAGGRGERAWVFFINIINHGPSFVNRGRFASSSRDQRQQGN